MSDANAASVLRRMIGAKPAEEAAEMTLERAMRMALAKAGSRALGVPVNAGDLAEATMTVEDLCQDLPQQALF